MIDLSQYNNLPVTDGVLGSYITQPLSSTNFQVIKHPLTGINKWLLVSGYSGSTSSPDFKMYSDDGLSYLTIYCSELLNREFSSILIGGLGLGTIPFLLKDYCSTVDIVEINQEVINLIEPIGHLSGCTIINDDIYTHQPSQTYDVILLDIWTCDCGPNYETELNTLITKYLPSLNANGVIYAPINSKLGNTLFFSA